MDVRYSLRARLDTTGFDRPHVDELRAGLAAQLGVSRVTITVANHVTTVTETGVKPMGLPVRANRFLVTLTRPSMPRLLEFTIQPA